MSRARERQAFAVVMSQEGEMTNEIQWHTVASHSREWEQMVEPGWVTWTVTDGGAALMLWQGRPQE